METLSKTALITGGSGGIGLELAKLFAKDKYNLILVARDEVKLMSAATELMAQYNIQVVTLARDLFKRESPFEIYDELKSKGMTVNVLVNNAGQGEYGEFSETDINREFDIIQLNIGAYISMTKLFLQDMLIRNEGKILNVGSIAGEMPGPWQSVYHGTKAFVNSWSEAIRNELKDTNISVTVLLPGATETDFFNKASMQDSKILETGLSNPAEVAKDGYKALMSGDDKIISGFKNKAMVAMGNVTPDSMAAENMRKQQEPSDKG
ncbi:SDR family NAD(P)-dependent oxidoreductase [Arcticibacter tournemirensis]|uniref:SDR family oxidoreductase n=1 Tax=Arcticibacter tournemirensis TaxID=699437 RepID=A0A4Q0M5L3_9SPHI|nr:SDR family oxidoreductase [Arcticibacter tournemirensis]RXF68311.1 SDR family oxidoreductase [Arcticibacter tournemirensis]